MAIASAATVATPALAANIALELAPVRVNLIAAGFVDTPLRTVEATSDDFSVGLKSGDGGFDDSTLWVTEHGGGFLAG